MLVQQTRRAPRCQRAEGITSWLLVSRKTCGAERLTATVVAIEPGGHQRVHHHAPEQLYFVIEGHGRMTVGEEARDVGPGDCVFVPSDAPHGLENTGDERLRYVSAAAPPFTDRELDELWPLPPEVDS